MANRPPHEIDAVVVGAGPNGLAAAITLARAGWSVVVREAADVPGGACRSAALTRPGFVHDVGSAVHPLAALSPIFRQWPLAEHGLRWVEPPIALAHPFDDGPPALLVRSLADTATMLDAPRYGTLMAPLVERWEALLGDVLAPPHLPRHPLLLARFGLPALLSAPWLARLLFPADRGRAWFVGLAGHAGAPLDGSPTAAFALVLALAGHVVGWPMPVGGAQAITDALVSYVRSLGGTIETGAPVRRLDELPAARAVLLDIGPRQFLALAGSRLPVRYRDALARYRYAPGAFKMDWALSAPIPWRDPECARAGTLHLAGSEAAVRRSEAAPWRGETDDHPYVILAQPTRFDPSRAPPGYHVAWAYCHVPNGASDAIRETMAARIEAQIERFAPGFRDCVLARTITTPAALERGNANLVGGDVGGGATTLSQLVTRPTRQLDPYRTPLPGVYLCSAATPPGGGVHGICGYSAACSALMRAGAF
jgi:phytoene dehydrogenase-like protein